MKKLITILLGMILISSCQENDLFNQQFTENYFVSNESDSSPEYYVSFTFNGEEKNTKGSACLLEYNEKEIFSFSFNFPHEEPNKIRVVDLNLYNQVDKNSSPQIEMDLKNYWLNRLEVVEVGTTCGTPLENYDSILFAEPNYLIIENIALDSSYIEGRFTFTMTEARCLLGWCPDKNYVIQNPHYWEFTEGRFRVPFNKTDNVLFTRSYIEQKQLAIKKKLKTDS